MRKRIWIRTILVCTVLILVVLMIYGGLRIMESAVFSEGQQESVATRTIIKDGVQYYPRQDVHVVMVLGIDQKGKVVPSEEPNHGNAVDMVTLLVFDEKDKTISLLCLNRDTMVEMPRLNEFGRETGTRVAQLALSHTYGRGMEDSCNNTKKAVSNLLHRITIDHYFAMNLDAISILNDAVGGVTVKVEEDFSQIDPSIKMGEMTLYGDQAVAFVQSRRGIGDQLNLSRMQRQQQYMQGFLSALKTKAAQSSEFAVSAYDAVSEYIVTDMTPTVISRLMEDYRGYELRDVLTLPGENVLAEQYYEFHVDKPALEELVLSLFFAQKN